MIVALCRWKRKSRLLHKCWLPRNGTWQRSRGSWVSLHSMSWSRTWARAGRKSLHPQRMCPVATCALWASPPAALEEQLHLSLHYTLPQSETEQRPSCFNACLFCENMGWLRLCSSYFIFYGSKSPVFFLLVLVGIREPQKRWAKLARKPQQRSPPWVRPSPES